MDPPNQSPISESSQQPIPCSENQPDEEDDPFDAVLNLEEQYYAEGYSAGVADGERAGLIEGRLFGMEKGFEKFLEMGRLNGRAKVWAARLEKGKSFAVKGGDGAGDLIGKEEELKPLRHSERLEKHVTTLCALSEIESLDMRNTEDAVGEFDDRYKRAVAKVKVIESIIGEESPAEDAEKPGKGSKSGEKGKGKASLRLTREGRGAERNIEDFGVK